jgi:hypothetical protein
VGNELIRAVQVSILTVRPDGGGVDPVKTLYHADGQLQAISIHSYEYG